MTAREQEEDWQGNSHEEGVPRRVSTTERHREDQPTGEIRAGPSQHIDQHRELTQGEATGVAARLEGLVNKVLQDSLDSFEKRLAAIVDRQVEQFASRLSAIASQQSSGS